MKVTNRGQTYSRHVSDCTGYAADEITLDSGDLKSLAASHSDKAIARVVRQLSARVNRKGKTSKLKGHAIRWNLATPLGTEKYRNERVEVVHERNRLALSIDSLTNGKLVAAADAYVSHQAGSRLPVVWPLGVGTWHPSESRKQNLVKGGAYVLAELERRHRAGLRDQSSMEDYLTRIYRAIRKENEREIAGDPDLAHADFSEIEKRIAGMSEPDLAEMLKKTKGPNLFSTPGNEGCIISRFYGTATPKGRALWPEGTRTGRFSAAEKDPAMSFGGTQRRRSSATEVHLTSRQHGKTVAMTLESFRAAHKRMTADIYRALAEELDRELDRELQEQVDEEGCGAGMAASKSWPED